MTVVDVAVVEGAVVEGAVVGGAVVTAVVDACVVAGDVVAGNVDGGVESVPDPQAVASSNASGATIRSVVRMAHLLNFMVRPFG